MVNDTILQIPQLGNFNKNSSQCERDACICIYIKSICMHLGISGMQPSLSRHIYRHIYTSMGIYKYVNIYTYMWMDREGFMSYSLSESFLNVNI